jgi:uncharacterized iron-regulated membrane protein
MKGPYLNRLHRYVGISMAPFLLLQTLSGLFLDFGLFRRGQEEPQPAARGWWDLFLVKLHFAPGLVSDAYHLLLGAAIFWMAISGWLLYLRIRRVRMNAAVVRPQQPGAAPPPGGAP